MTAPFRSRLDLDSPEAMAALQAQARRTSDLLKALSHETEIQTITPAVISRVRGRSPELQLRVSTPITGGYKLVARNGTSAQEVFVVTSMSRPDLEQAVLHHRP